MIQILTNTENFIKDMIQVLTKYVALMTHVGRPACFQYPFK